MEKETKEEIAGIGFKMVIDDFYKASDDFFQSLKDSEEALRDLKLKAIEFQADMNALAAKNQDELLKTETND